MVNMIELGDFRVATLNQRSVGRTIFINRDITYNAEDSLELRQSVFCRFWTRKLLMIECHRPVRVLNGNQRFVEATFSDRARCACLTYKGKVINRVTINTF